MLKIARHEREQLQAETDAIAFLIFFFAIICSLAPALVATIILFSSVARLTFRAVRVHRILVALTQLTKGCNIDEVDDTHEGWMKANAARTRKGGSFVGPSSFLEQRRPSLVSAWASLRARLGPSTKRMG